MKRAVIVVRMTRTNHITSMMLASRFLWGLLIALAYAGLGSPPPKYEYEMVKTIAVRRNRLLMERRR